jgi:hypothetical protein
MLIPRQTRVRILDGAVPCEPELAVSVRSRFKSARPEFRSIAWEAMRKTLPV